jgi:hypothetical protein
MVLVFDFSVQGNKSEGFSEGRGPCEIQHVLRRYSGGVPEEEEEDGKSIRYRFLTRFHPVIHMHCICIQKLVQLSEVAEF